MNAHLKLTYDRRDDGVVIVRAEGPAREIVDDAGRPRVVQQPPLSDIPVPELRALARRFYRRTVDPHAEEHWMDAGTIPSQVQAGLARLQRFLHADVLRRMDHPVGFEIDAGSALARGDVAVSVVEGLLQAKCRDGRACVVAPTGAPWGVERVEKPRQRAPRRLRLRERERLEAMRERGVILEVPKLILPPNPLPPLQGAHALRSHLPELAILELLITARYWPFIRCTRCRTVFVPGKVGQRYCSRRCGRANNYAIRMRSPTAEAEQRRRKAVEVAKDHARAKRRGTWTRVRAPGAGRPRKQKEG